MSEAKKGDTVQIHYTGKLDDGTLFDTSSGSEPLEFELGSGEVIAGFDKAVTGMAEGESKVVKLAPDEAYGDRHEQLVQQVPRSAFPSEIDPEVGMALQSKSPDGETTRLTVTEVEDESITVDANHPLAGYALNFEIELVKIN